MTKYNRVLVGRPYRPKAERLCPCGQPSIAGQLGYCSPDCRFDAKFERGDEDECWNWLAPLNVRGRYATVLINGRTILAHRYAYERANGQAPHGLEIHHTCENTRCVNPRHLQALTKQKHEQLTDQGAYNKIKTHCPRGHEYAGDNLRIDTRGKRSCRTCNRDRESRRYQARKSCQFVCA